jgi:hypothetical protein
MVTLAFMLCASVARPAEFAFQNSGGTIKITKYLGEGGDVVVPDLIDGSPVTAIGSYAFSNCRSVTNVTIPESVTVIEEGAFWMCQGLRSLSLPSHLTSIEEALLQGCEHLESLMIPEGVTNIGAVAFNGCDSLTNVIVPDHVLSVGANAFHSCRNLTNLTIGRAVTTIGMGAFDYCYSLAAITVNPLNGSFAFVDGVLLNKSLTTVIRCLPAKAGGWSMPNSVTQIEDWAFACCGRLTSVTIGTNVTSIGDYAFELCTGLTNVTIPNSVISIGDYAFFSCMDLTDVTIANSVINIGKEAFAYCMGLTVVTIPDSVLEIRERAFYGCAVEAYYFQGSTPSVSPDVFEEALVSPVIYYLPGASGWGLTFAGYPTALWLPRITTNDKAFGVRSSQFGFNINWASGKTVVIEASADCGNPIWLPISTNKLVSSTFFFADPGWTNHPTRIYRLRSR